MAYLKETNNALSELYANQQYRFGMHLHEQVRAGRRGLFVGETAFDPARHNVADINHMSLMADAMGIPHVRNVIPSHPLDVNLVVHHAPNEDRIEIDRAKQLLAVTVRQSVVESKPNATDWLHSYLLGDVEEGLIEFDVIDRNVEDPKNVRRTLLDICSSGLAIVISDFESFDLAGMRRKAMKGAVGIRVSHAWEWELPAKTGVWTSGDDGKEYNTRKPKHLQAYKEASAARHARTKAEMERVGLTVAEVVFDYDLYEPGHAKQLGFDVAETDLAIAAAIRLAEKQL